MLSLIKGLIDRLVFCCLIIVGMQLPEFISQYHQRLQGHLNESRSHLSSYQLIADNQYKGDLSALIHAYKTNQDQAIFETGELIQKINDRVAMLTEQDSQLNGTYWQQIGNIVTALDKDIASATLTIYKPALPLSIESMATGLIFATVFYLLVMGLVALTISTTRSLTTKHPQI